MCMSHCVCRILWTPSIAPMFKVCMFTILGCLLWNPPDTKSPCHVGMSQDYLVMSFVGSFRHQVTLAVFRDAQDYSGMSRLGYSGHQVLVTPIFRDARTVLGCPLWDILRTPSYINLQGFAEMSCMGCPSGNSSRKQFTPTFRNVPGLSCVVPRRIYMPVTESEPWEYFKRLCKSCK